MSHIQVISGLASLCQWVSRSSRSSRSIPLTWFQPIYETHMYFLTLFVDSQKPTLNQKPTLKLLNRYVRGSVGLKWHDLGIELLDVDDVEDLDKIEAEHPLDLNKCCTKMFQLWLKKQPAASWNQLVIALKGPDIELHALATKIEQIVLQPKPTG